MRLFSSPSETDGAVGGFTWLAAMLVFESGLAGALADVGLAPREVADEIWRVCDDADGYDLEELRRGTARDGTPVPALLAQLRQRLSDDAQAVLHRGATSQDVVDTATMMVAHLALASLLADLDAAGDAAAALADRHRSDLAAGRTLLQQATPITFGLRAANWLTGLDDAAARLTAIRDERLAVQLGGAAGNLAAFGDDGPAVVEALARRLELAAPSVPWHTNRSRPAELAAALGQAAGAAGKVGTDVVLLAQTEVGEVAEGQPGASSAMPHKRNPAAAVTAVAAARRTPGLVATMLAAMPGEQERAAGAWQAEVETLSDLLRLTGAGVAAARRSLEGLEVFPERMRANVEVSGDLGANDELIDRALAAHRARTGGTA
jgi:3-carboxy-cis,cis-muconate cycloisomerase